MNIIESNEVWEPETFTQGYNFKVFINKYTGEVIGCGNITYDKFKNSTTCFISYLEAYDNHGHDIVDYLMKLNQDVCLIGESYDDTLWFWYKMGATLEEHDGDLYGDLYSFKLHKSNFIKTKYSTLTEN